MSEQAHQFTAIRDAHLHLAEHGEELSCVHLAGCRSVAECLDLISAAARELPSDAWLKATGARVEAWAEPRYPTADELQDAGDGRLVMALSFDHHAMAVSRSVLELAGISRATEDPEDGIIDRKDGEPTGLLLEAACDLVRAVRPKKTMDDWLRHTRLGLDDLAGHGFVEVHDMHSEPELFRTLVELERAGELAMRVWMYATPRSFDAMVALAEEYGESDRVRLAGLKLFTDGTLNSRTAFMLHPFADPLPEHPCGTPFYSADELDGMIRHAAAAGYPTCAHAIGDGAVRAMLDALERAGSGMRGHRIEHCQFVDERDVPRFAELDVIASLQPCHLLTDIEAIRRLVPDRAGRAFPLRELVDSMRAAGREPAELIWLGSDAPIVPPDPADNVQAAVQRRRRGMPEAEAVGREQAISEAECLSLMRPSLCSHL